MDRVTQEKRSEIMKSVKGKNTGPEMEVRRELFRLGYRYRLHSSHLPGRPDIVFPGRSKVIFVNGCFWHGHRCKKGRLPKSHIAFWRNKIDTNKRRDSMNRKELRKLGWGYLVVWQCQLANRNKLFMKIIDFLETNTVP